jgi:hypothetical protein
MLAARGDTRQGTRQPAAVWGAARPWERVALVVRCCLRRGPRDELLGLPVARIARDGAD